MEEGKGGQERGGEREKWEEGKEKERGWSRETVVRGMEME